MPAVAMSTVHHSKQRRQEKLVEAHKADKEEFHSDERWDE